MAFLEFPESGRRFEIDEAVTLISSSDVHDATTCIIEDESVNMKHAAIVNKNSNYQIIDLCRNGTSIKTSDSFEPLDSFTFHDICHSDFLRFGSVIVKFNIGENEEVIGSSQPAMQHKTVQTEVLVPESETIQDLETHDDIEIPETQIVEIDDRSNSSNAFLEIKQTDDVSNQGMFSQNVIAESQNLFAEISFKNNNKTDEDDVLDEIMQVQEEPPTVSKSPQLRDGSITPDIEMTPDPAKERTTDIFIVKQEPSVPSLPDGAQVRIFAENIKALNPEMQVKQERLSVPAAHLDDTEIIEDCENNCESEKENRLMEPTQPVFVDIKTRYQKKRQSDNKPPTVSLTEFDETQDFAESIIPLKKRKLIYSMETQPVFPVIPPKAKTSQSLNRILVSDESDDEPMNSDNPGAEKNENMAEVIKYIINELNSQPEGEASSSPKTPAPAHLMESSLLNQTPDILPHSPRDSQIETILKFGNATNPNFNESAIDSDVSCSDDSNLNDSALKQLTQPEPDTLRPIPKRTRRNFMRFGSDSDDDKPLKSIIVTSEEMPTASSSDTKKTKFPMTSANATKKAKSPTTPIGYNDKPKLPEEKNLEPINLEPVDGKKAKSPATVLKDKPKLPEQKQSLEAKILEPAEEKKAKSPGTSTGFKDKPKLPVEESKELKILEPVDDKKAKPEISNVTNKEKTPSTILKVMNTKKPKLASEEKKKPQAKPKESVEEKKLYSFAISGYEEAKTMYSTIGQQLGGNGIVARISEADFLLTSSNISPTSKVLASVCKGIPIVSDEFMKNSVDAGKWLNPQDYIVHGTKMEKQKKIVLKEIIEKAKKEKLFAESSVLATPNTRIPFDQLKDIIENAGGECLKARQKPSHENLYVCYNAADTKEFNMIKKKYKNITEILDTTLSHKIMHQEL